MVDTAQGAGHVFDDIDDVDMIAFAGHKGLYGIGGAGGLIVKNNVELNPIIFGGTGTASESLIQPKDVPEGFESGTLANIPIIALGAGVDYVSRNRHYIVEKEHRLNVAMYNMLKSLDFIRLYSNEDALGVYSFNVDGMDSSLVGDYLSENFGVCTRAGLHCAPLIHQHLGTQQTGAVRVSIDSNNTIDDIKILEKALKSLYNKV